MSEYRAAINERARATHIKNVESIIEKGVEKGQPISERDVRRIINNLTSGSTRAENSINEYARLGKDDKVDEITKDTLNAYKIAYSVLPKFAVREAKLNESGFLRRIGNIIQVQELEKGASALSLFEAPLKRERKERKEMKSLIEDFGTDPRARASIAPIIKKALDSEDKDRRAAFIVLTVDTEKKLREFASFIADFREPLPVHQVAELLIKRGILGERWRKPFRVLWSIRNKVIHSMSVTDAEIELGTSLAASLIVNLEGIEAKLKLRLPGSQFEIFKDSAGEYRFRLRAPNGEIIAASEGYKTKYACKNGIESIRKNFPRARIQDLTG